MRYRIKLTVVVKTPQGATHTYNKYFRSTSVRKAAEKQTRYLEGLKADGCVIVTQVSVGGWVN